MAGNKKSVIFKNALKFEELTETDRLWQSFVSDGNKSSTEFSRIAGICIQEISHINADGCKFPAKFIQELTYWVNDNLSTAVTRLENLRKLEAIDLLHDLSNNLISLFRLLKYYLWTKETKLDKNLFGAIFNFSRWLESSINDGESNSIDLYIKLLSLGLEVLCLGGNGKSLLPIFNFFAGQLNEFITMSNLHALGNTPYETDFISQKFLKTHSHNQHMDIVNFMLFSLNFLGKKDQGLCAKDELTSIIPKIFNYIQYIDDFRNCRNSLQAELAMQKSYYAINILFLISAEFGKSDHGRIIGDNEEKIKAIFFYYISTYMKHFFTVNSENFESEEGYLGILYNLIFELLSLSIHSSDVSANSIMNNNLEALPLVLFNFITQEVIVT